MRLSGRTIALFGAIALGAANLGRVPLGALAGRNAPIMLSDMAALLVWAAVGVAVLQGKRRIVVDQVTRAALLFLSVATISTVFAVGRYGFSFEIVAYLARWVLYFGWYPFVAWCLDEADAGVATRYTDHALMFICVFGIVQSVFLPEFASLLPDIGDMPAWEYQGRRLVSTLLDPNFAGAMAVLAFLPRLARVSEGLHERSLSLILPVAAIALSASRSSVLGLLVGIGTLVMARGLNRRIVKTVGIGALLLIPAIPALLAFGESMNKFTVDTSAAQRLVTWKRALTLFAEHPVLGIGFNATRQAQMARGWKFIGGADTAFDGGLLFVMVMTGVVGAALYALLLWRGVSAARRTWNAPDADAEQRAHAAGTAASVTAILVHSLFSNSLLLPFVMQVLWVRFARLAHGPASRRSMGAWAALPLVAVTACSPCFGTIGCTVSPFTRLQGSVVAFDTGAPIPNAIVRIAFQGTEQTYQRVDTTDANGAWDVSAPTTCCDRVQAAGQVEAPGQAAYVVPGFPARILRDGGDAQVVGRWLDRPLARYGISFVHDSVPLVGAAVTFLQTGGVPVSLLRLDTSTDINGIFRFDATSDRVGDVLATITVTHPSLPQPWTLKGLTIPVTNTAELIRVVGFTIYDLPPLIP